VSDYKTKAEELLRKAERSVEAFESGHGNSHLGKAEQYTRIAHVYALLFQGKR
jgi:hypothetical protein